ncbi:MAG: aspartate aminotransferase family protein [Phormidesmis sp.]
MFNASDYTDVLHQIEDFFNRSTYPHSVLNGEPRIEENQANQKANQKADNQANEPGNALASGREAALLGDRLNISFPAQGKPLSALHRDIATYLNHAVHTAHPSYCNQLWGGFSAAAFMADMITSAANTSMYTYEVAPIATLIEQALIAKMGQLVGFDNPGGQFTTGGSNGNLMAMAMARHQAIPHIKQAGLGDHPQLIAFVSQEAHYSFIKAAQLLGLGSQNLWKVPVDEYGQLRVSELKRLINLARGQGALPFFVAGTAGTTVRGAYDPLEAIGAIARQEKLWFHVDSAWGGGALLSTRHRAMLRGINQADSVVWDAHKMMGMTLVCSVLLTKQRGVMHSAFSATDTDYLFHEDEAEPTDLGPSTLHCGRRVDAVKLWLAWQHLGDEGWKKLIDQYFELAERAEAIVRAHASLEMVFPRQSLNLCFRYVPTKTTGNEKPDSNALTLQIRQRLLKTGLAMVNYATLEGSTFFRLVLCNNQTSVVDIERFFKDVIETGRAIEQEGYVKTPDNKAAGEHIATEDIATEETVTEAAVTEAAVTEETLAKETGAEQTEERHIPVKQLGESSYRKEKIT